jgi:hypothetical protein
MAEKVKFEVTLRPLHWRPWRDRKIVVFQAERFMESANFVRFFNANLSGGSVEDVVWFASNEIISIRKV